MNTTQLQFRIRIPRTRTHRLHRALLWTIALLAPGIVTQSVQAAEKQNSVYTVLYTFTGGVDGGQPLAPLIRDSAGNLYGTAQSGGSFNFGVVFKVSPTGQQTVLHHFTGKADGGYPTAGLIQDAAGNLYGTTSGGGVRCIASGTGCGVIFKLDPAGNETVLYRFTAGPDGAFPGGTLLRDNSGTLYGTAAQGGIAGACGGLGCGVVFEISATGQHRVLYTFTGGTDGGEPVGGVIRDSAGNFYGTASLGGISGGCGIGCGVVFKLTPTGQESVLYTFQGGLDGGVPAAGLRRDQAGNLYGTTEYRGTSDWGVVFKLDPSGNETVLHSFTGGSDGATPRSDLIRDSVGNIYGTTVQGGSGCAPFACVGVVFRLDTTGSLTVLHTFRGTDGSLPYAGLVGDQGGNLYGTTSAGGAFGYGVVFKLVP